MINYYDRYIRNIGILTKSEQEKIHNCRVSILGCGGGSEIARELVQSGFVNLFIADYDNVELHNLNRQYYFQEDIGRNKAISLEKNLRLINPDINCQAVSSSVEIDNIAEIVKKSDLVIDAIPPETELKKEIFLTREIRKYDDKYHLYFMDLVWGAKLIIFSKNSGGFEEFIGLNSDCLLSDAESLTLEQLTKPYIEGASVEMIRVGKLMYEQKLSYFPQMSTSISLAASMTVTACIFLTLGKKIKLAPSIYSIDYYKMFAE